MLAVQLIHQHQMINPTVGTYINNGKEQAPKNGSFYLSFPIFIRTMRSTTSRGAKLFQNCTCFNLKAQTYLNLHTTQVKLM